jgi:hypothetical protein
VITAVENQRAPGLAGIDAALAGGRPLVPIQAAKEFLRGAEVGGINALREFLAARRGRLAAAASEDTADALRWDAASMDLIGNVPG